MPELYFFDTPQEAAAFIEQERLALNARLKELGVPTPDDMLDLNSFLNSDIRPVPREEVEQAALALAEHLLTRPVPTFPVTDFTNLGDCGWLYPVNDTQVAMSVGHFGPARPGRMRDVLVTVNPDRPLWTQLVRALSVAVHDWRIQQRTQAQA